MNILKDYIKPLAPVAGALVLFGVWVGSRYLGAECISRLDNTPREEVLETFNRSTTIEKLEAYMKKYGNSTKQTEP